MDEQVKVSSRSSVQKAISQITITAICLALAMIINMICRQIPGFSFPNGGSVSLIYIPLAICALYCGPVWGFFIGCAYGLLDLLIDGGFATHWISILCDYIFSYIGVGFAGFLSPLFLRKHFYSIPLSLVIIGIFRLFMTFLSGCTIYSQASNISEGILVPDFSLGGISFSLSYNAGYILPGVALSLGLIVLMTKPLFQMMNLPYIKALTNGKNSDDNRTLTADKISNMDLMPVYFVAMLILAILAIIPSFKMYFLGYISLVGSAILLGSSIYKLYFSIRDDIKFDEKDYLAFFKKPTYFYITIVILFAIVLALSILGICSFYTYGAPSYN